MAISANSSGGSSVNADINVTPMIDVMLVLLIIFMIVTPLISTGFTATMPVGETVKSETEEENEVTLGLDNQGNYFVNGKQTTAADAEQTLTALFAEREEDKRLFFKAHAELPYAKIQEAVEIGRRSGARMLVAVTESKGGLAGMTDDEDGED